MTFEEDFPSLKDVHWDSFLTSDDGEDEYYYVDTHDIENFVSETLLDKQRVRKVIEELSQAWAIIPDKPNIEGGFAMSRIVWEKQKQFIYKELGL